MCIRDSHPSYRTIGRAVQLSENTVRKYVAGLEEKGLIHTEPSTIITKDGRMRNGSLIYTIRPIQEALEQNYQRQFRQAEESVERARVQKRLAELEQRSNVKTVSYTHLDVYKRQFLLCCAFDTFQTYKG